MPHAFTCTGCWSSLPWARDAQAPDTQRKEILNGDTALSQNTGLLFFSIWHKVATVVVDLLQCGYRIETKPKRNRK